MFFRQPDWPACFDWEMHFLRIVRNDCKELNEKDVERESFIDWGDFILAEICIFEDSGIRFVNEVFEGLILQCIFEDRWISEL